MKLYATCIIKGNIRWFMRETHQNGTHDALAYCLGYYGNISDIIFDTVMEMYADGELVAGSHFVEVKAE